MIIIFIGFTIINLGILALMIKLYTEILKDSAMNKRMKP